MKGIFKEKMVDQLMGNNDGGAVERVASKLLNSDVVIRRRHSEYNQWLLQETNAVPAGYDVPSYDPYAQEVQPNQQQQIMEQQAYDCTATVPTTTDATATSATTTVPTASTVPTS